MTAESVVGLKLDGSGGAVALMEIARSSVWRIQTLLGDMVIGHGSAFAYKQVIDPAAGTSKVFLLTNLHNFSGPLKTYSTLVEFARRGAQTEALTMRSVVAAGDQRFELERIIAAKDALFAHNRPYFQDFAVVEVSIPTTEKLKMFVLPDKADAQAGDSIYALGYPRDTDLGITEGITSHVYGADAANETYRWQIQHSVLINGGNSGGPTVNRFGVAVGISTWGWINENGMNFSVNVAHVLSILGDPSEVEEVNLNAIFRKLASRAIEEARYGG
jgi:hypothetical protein